MNDQLSTLLSQRVADVYPDVDRLIGVATRTGTRIRRRRCAMAGIGALTATAVIGGGVWAVAPSGTTAGDGGIGFAGAPSAPATPAPRPSSADCVRLAQELKVFLGEHPGGLVTSAEDGSILTWPSGHFGSGVGTTSPPTSPTPETPASPGTAASPQFAWPTACGFPGDDLAPTPTQDPAPQDLAVTPRTDLTLGDAGYGWTSRPSG